MKYKNVLLKKPSNYEFVKGASIQTALSVLVNNFIDLNISRSPYLDGFGVYANPNSSSKFGSVDVSEEIILQRAKEDARFFAVNDYLDNSFVDGFRVGDYYSFSGSLNYWDELDGDSTIDSGKSFRYHLNYADNLSGVLLFFNKKLSEHKIIPNNDLSRDYDSLLVFPQKAVTRNCLVGIQPLGKIEEERLDNLVKYYS